MPEEQRKKPNNNNETAPAQPGPLSAKAKAALHGTGAGSWQAMLAFGTSFAVRVGVLGFWLGGWIDRRFFGGTGYAALFIILAVIIYSFVMLYRDVMRQDRRQRRLIAAAEQKERAGRQRQDE